MLVAWKYHISNAYRFICMSSGLWRWMFTSILLPAVNAICAWHNQDISGWEYPGLKKVNDNFSQTHLWLWGSVLWSCPICVCLLFEEEMMQLGRGWSTEEDKQINLKDDIKEQTRWTAAMKANGEGRGGLQVKWGEGERGGALTAGDRPKDLRTVWTRLDTEMRWRNVTHAINELPVCLPKWRLSENALGHRHLGRITNPLLSAPVAVCYYSKMSSDWFGGSVPS